ncbi:hypothetical protein [Paenibacillus sp. FSL E2-0190]|uniref:hypothetical protein n=1 Tax=Paenibacillus sp. FSL E2-0190 TaxID=2954504 RepID=UPI0030ED0227
MKKEFKEYAQLIGQIGEQIGRISEEIGKVNLIAGTTVEILKHRRDAYYKSIEDYRNCKSKLEQMNVPKVIESEHKNFVDAFDHFIKGSLLAFNSINLENSSIDEEMVKKGMREQKSAEILAVGIIEKITQKIINN